MAIQSNINAYFQSLTDEVMTKAARVRQLIGGRHWLTDGTHKEAIVSDTLRGFTLERLNVTKGFILGDVASASCSTEQDILLLDKAHDAPLYSVDGVSIALGRSAVAAISVKSEMTRKSLHSALSGLQSAHDAASKDANEGIATAAIFFGVSKDWEGRTELVYKNIEAWFANTAGDRGYDCTNVIRDTMLIVLPSLVFQCQVREHPHRELHILGYDTDRLGIALLVARISEHCPKLDQSYTTSIYESLSRERMNRTEPPTYTASLANVQSGAG